MTIRAIITSALTAGAVGIALLAVDHAAALAGILVGAAAASVPAAIIVARRTSRLDTAAADLDARRAQYESAFATLAAQRERLRAGLDHQLAQQRAELTATHKRDLLKARMEGYMKGASDALGGALLADADEQPAAARVIELAERRPAPSLVD